ncbi:hypothetical protein P8452_41302 [Trifolium repens]|nr:hypothetical protein QL285_025343 [Trifolium repens]WJX55537.1 hypothetical protein P8452_41302 [Trifolium repens]
MLHLNHHRYRLLFPPDEDVFVGHRARGSQLPYPTNLETNSLPEPPDKGSQPLIKSGASGGVFILDVELLAGTLKVSY